MLSIRFYQDYKIFKQEEKKIFTFLWLFFGITQEFEKEEFAKNNGDVYVRKTIAGEDIFIVNNGHEYTGFINRCPHRFHPIVQEDYGKTNLVCPYHYWSFEKDGRLRGIPYEKECYQFLQAKRKTISLDKIAVKKLGSFLFVNLAKDPIPFETQFWGQYLNEVKELSISFVNYRKIKLTQKFNWKLIQENLRDGLHPAFLHKSTLLNAIAFGPPAIPKEVPMPLLSLKDASFGGPDVKLNQQFDQKQSFTNKWKCEQRYYNFHLFPALHIAAGDGGYSFVLENYIPLGPLETEIELYFILTANSLDNAEENNLFDKLIVNALAVYTEDFKVLEAIQGSFGRNKATQSTYPINGAYERLITRFQKIYLKKMGIKFYLKQYVLDLSLIPQFLISHLSLATKKIKVN